MNAPTQKLLKIRAGALTLAATTILAIIGEKNRFGYFLRNAKDEELEAAQGKVRLDFCNSDLDNDYRINCQKALGAFDREMRKRTRGSENPHTPSYHSEHGWYLSSDDCPMRVYMF